MDVTNQRIQVTKGAVLQVSCRGGQHPNWKMGATDIVTSASSNVYQFRVTISALLLIKSMNPSNAGTYTCHIGRIQESVTLGEYLIILSTHYHNKQVCYVQI